MANRFKKIYSILAIASLIVALTFHAINFSPAQAQILPLERARNAYQSGQYQTAIALLENYLKTSANEAPAEVYRYLSAAYQQIGQLGQAIRNRDKAMEIYRDKEDTNSRRQLATIAIEQAQAYLGLGQNQKAISLLEEAIAIANNLQVRAISARAQGVLGNAYLQSGNYPQAIEAYHQTLTIARDKNWVAIESAALNNLTTASSRLAEKYRRDARLAIQEKDESEAQRLEQLAVQQERNARKYAFDAVAASQALQGETTVRALLNLLPFLEPSEAPQRSQQALAIANKLPDSRTKVYLLLELAQQFQQPILERATSIAIAIDDKRGLSFAFGKLGEAYERIENYDRALEYAQQAQLIAGEIFAYDSLYRWWWLLGRIYRATGRLEESKSAYQNAIASLQKIRGDIAIATKEFQLDFRDEVEPIYRELLTLLLAEDGQEKEALSTFDRLQLAEIESFFGDICIEVERPTEVLKQSRTVAIASVILNDKTYLILQRPDGKLHRYQIEITSDELTRRVRQWRNSLEDVFSNQYLTQSQALYQLLIRPLESELQAIAPQSLIFIPDRILRNVPLAALHDGKQFLVEKYPIAVSLGFNLTFAERATHKLSSLIFGLTEARPPFQQKFPDVARETQAVQEILGGERFMNKEFSWENFREQLLNNESSIIHLATHGIFTGIIERSYLQTFDRPVALTDLESLLTKSKQPIDLLTLSACQTAAGNDRSVLGMAGIALRSGVKSLLGSLWFSNDAASTELMADFYQHLKQGSTKAKAFQEAQKSQIANPASHPGIWSNLVLVGNWL